MQSIAYNLCKNFGYVKAYWIKYVCSNNNYVNNMKILISIIGYNTAHIKFVNMCFRIVIIRRLFQDACRQFRNFTEHFVLLYDS